ncbi:hypothetical protein STIUS_v1c02650 [Spiroplasma sp. TIUS-1]|uniref:BspA family leucine-rich repeat surface protein n=1 Tax=Spiroplasma sp. TIUS-1 TaxID=216963 RepID=UPI0013994BCD|nr:BspA family leucine-rich repeat surface protein [Spiroplasma sp. TIUS-1]QHX35819.1 hypothetical protein STIUS_v1c02650 [Spiroplasma sp. TIUS-1]
MKADNNSKNKRIKITSIAAVILIILILLSTFLSLYFFLWKNDRSTSTHLNTVITETELGWIDDNEDLKILNSVESLNSKANGVALKVKEKNETTASIFSTDLNYVGNVDVKFEQRQDINTLLSEAPIIIGDEILGLEVEEIIEKIKDENPKLKELELLIEDFVPGEKIKFVVTTSTEGYTGKITFFITKISLSNVIVNKDLGLIKDKNEETIKNEIINKNKNNEAILKSLDESFIFEDTNFDGQKWTTKISVKNDDKFDPKPVEVSFLIPDKLDSIITKTDLGYLNDDKDDSILSEIKSINNISEEMFKDLDLQITRMTKNKDEGPKEIVVYSKNPSYTGKVKVSFNIKKYISKIIKELDLGLISNPKPETIIEAIKSKNDIPEDLKIEISDIKDTTAMVTTTSEKYQGHVIVNYVLNILIELETEKEDIYIDEQKEINIINFNLLTDLKVIGDEFVSAELIDGKILIKGLKNGKGSLTVTASNALEAKTIKVNVSNKIEIKVDKNELELLAGETQIIIVSNWEKLINPKAIKKEGNINIKNNNGSIAITAEENAGNGNAQITISADNALKEQNILITIKEKIEIVTDKESDELYVGKSSTMNITNFADLTNLEVKAAGAVTATNVDGLITITAEATAGKGTITISADNAVASKVIKITVKENGWPKKMDSEWIDPTSGEIKSGAKIPEGVKKVTRIGYDGIGTAHRMPKSIIEVPDFISPKITNMGYMFESSKAFDQDISAWDVSNVTDMNRMFSGAKAFNQDISAWNVSNVTDMQNMFKGNQVFNQDISRWDVSSVTDMDQMFDEATKFNQNISRWDVSSVKKMYGMFRDAKAFNQNISAWNVSKVFSWRYFATYCPIDGTSKMPKFK